MMFDARAKENKSFLDFMESRRGLVVDPNSSSRVAARKMLGVLGIKSSNVDIAESFAEAMDKVGKSVFEIIVSEYEFGGHTAVELLKLQRERNPSSLDTIFLLLSEKNSPSIASQVAEGDFDGLVIRPFNMAALQDKFVEIVSGKLTPSKYQQILEKGKISMAEGKFPDAIKIFEAAQTLDSSPSLACYFAGMCHRKVGDAASAKGCFEAGLAKDPKHFKCLTGLFEILFEQKEFSRAYEVAAVLSKEFPVSPERIPQFVLLCVHNKKYDDILGYYDVLSTLEVKDPILQNSVAAGLVMAGKYFLKEGKTGDGVNALSKAETLARSKPAILKEILFALLSSGLKEESEALYKKLPTEMKDTKEIRLAELELQHIKNDAGRALQAGMDLIKMEVKDVRLYEIVILRSIESNRRKESIDELLVNARTFFPDKKELFDTLSEKAEEAYAEVDEDDEES